MNSTHDTILMMGHKICFYEEIWLIIPVTPQIKYILLHKEQKDLTQVITTFERLIPGKLARANSQYLQVKVHPKPPVSPS